jgi:hypothetical protein
LILEKSEIRVMSIPLIRIALNQIHVMVEQRQRPQQRREQQTAIQQLILEKSQE